MTTTKKTMTEIVGRLKEAVSLAPEQELELYYSEIEAIKTDPDEMAGYRDDAREVLFEALPALFSAFQLGMHLEDIFQEAVEEALTIAKTEFAEAGEE